MEKNDLIDLISDLREELKDDMFSKKLFVSLAKNVIFYNIVKDKIYDYKRISVLGFSLVISQYRNREFFKNDDKYDYINFLILTSKEFDTNSIKGFIILKNNRESIEYIKSISRDNKLKKIIE